MNLIMFENSHARMMSAKSDVTVNITKGHRDELRHASIYFRGGCHKKIAADCEFVSFGIEESMGRLYVLPAQRNEGFKIQKSRSKSVETVDVSLTIYPQHIAVWTAFSGDYDLLYDKEAKLHYIDRSLKK